MLAMDQQWKYLSVGVVSVNGVVPLFGIYKYI